MKLLHPKNLLIVLCLLMFGHLTMAVSVDDFLDRSYTNPKTKKVMRYRLFVPKNYDKTKQYPMVGFLHGCCEEADNEAQITSNEGAIFWAEDSIQKKHPSFVLAPNIGGAGLWANVSWENGNYRQDNYTLSESLENYINIIQELKKTYSIDSNRVYSTGLSMGGGGTWASLTRFPNLFAAAIPLCGYGDPSKMPLIKHIPVWTFHGDQDGSISVETTRELVKALKAAGGTVKYTEVAGYQHWIWHYAYTTPGLGVADWLFGQRRKSPITALADDKSSQVEMIAYPNPTKGEFSLLLPQGNFTKLQVYDMEGKPQYESNISSSEKEATLNLTSLPKGNYIIRLEGDKSYRKVITID
ncbi:MAG TPA: T9SS type A sorting domain-containing protein [Cytophagaceae bacterium]|jgi:poly(3-hydroxybutyrate) depolymerase